MYPTTRPNIRSRIGFRFRNFWGSDRGFDFGCKNHVNVDRTHKFIRDCRVTPASVHDSRCFEELLDENAADKGVWADSAYSGAALNEAVRAKGLVPHISEKGYRNRPLTPKQKEQNRCKSRVRSRVEHVFGIMSKLAQESRNIRSPERNRRPGSRQSFRR
ncbi:MAG: transposase [Planctomycetaceae bacterium]|nr:transposase [Planctomycetaceae bacterium]